MGKGTSGRPLSWQMSEGETHNLCPGKCHTPDSGDCQTDVILMASIKVKYIICSPLFNTSKHNIHAAWSGWKWRNKESKQPDTWAECSVQLETRDLGWEPVIKYQPNKATSMFVFVMKARLIVRLKDFRHSSRKGGSNKWPWCAQTWWAEETAVSNNWTFYVTKCMST